jgi:glycosyltransferase involved in cell wall biosynthesis
MPRVFVNLLQTTGTKGGIEIYAKELYKHLGKLETSLTFTGFASSELAKTDTSWFPGEVINSNISGENRFSWAKGELFEVSSTAKKYRSDLIHGPAMFGPLKSEIPVVTSFHDVLYFSHPELMQTKLFTEPVKWMEKRAAKISTRIITISEYSAGGIEKYLKVPRDRIDVIPLAGRKTEAQAQTSIREAGLFLAMGQRSPYKNFETIIRAWSHIPKSKRPRLIITGSHTNDPLVPLVEQLGLQDSIELKSWVSVEELDSLLGTATALIDSTLATGFSMPTLEAMNLGLPVLMADTEVFREVGGDAAVYFAAGSPESLATTVQDFIVNPSLRSTLSLRGLARSREYSWDKVAAQTEKSFLTALEQ